ncbi:MAG: glycoside hydrolase family 15 protein [Terriglobia bacterium]
MRATHDVEAFGRPGIEPRWTHGGKDGVGTAYSASSLIWFTLWNGIITEVYYPTVDRPQLRDLQYLITDGTSFFHEEKRHLKSSFERLGHALGYRCTNSDPEGRYAIVKEIITDPHLACILQHTRLTGDQSVISKLHVYALCAPHLDVGGWNNSGYVTEVAGRKLLMTQKENTWLALAATIPFSRVSCGYVGRSDGWTDLADNLQMDWEFDRVSSGNIALTGEIDLAATGFEFTLGLAFGDSEHHAIATLFQALGTPFEQHRQRYVEQWDRASRNLVPLEKVSCDGGNLYHSSFSLLLAHEDKSYPGAIIASLSIPWGESKSDEDQGGYHLVWTRDMVNSATGMLAAGNSVTPMRALIYLAVSQQKDGGFPQNFWINGKPYLRGIQLDEVAFPILLAWRMRREKALEGFDPYPMVLRAASYLVRHGPVTQQERWEEASGYSPSTLASNIAALICAACFARERHDDATAKFLEEYADFLESHVEGWTVTTDGTLVLEIRRHYIRILPEDVGNPCPDEDPNSGLLTIANRVPGVQAAFPAKEIVDAGFLELVRYGIRRPDDPLILSSLRVVDAVLKVNTAFGPCWHRYNHDGYGQRDDGGPFVQSGTGRAWPLLTGERGHYELAAGHDVKPLIRAMEAFASATGLLPEQVWDEADRPELHMHLGKPTGAAMPLMWAHAEYIKLLRSVCDGRVFDLIPEVEDRYLGHRKECQLLEIWKPNRQVEVVKRGYTLRIQMPVSFRLHWSSNEWRDAQDTESLVTALGIEYVDIPVPHTQQAPIRFAFFYTAGGQWETHDYTVSVQ